TICLYLGAEDTINSRYPKEISISVTNPVGSTRESLESMVPALVREEGYEILDILSYESFELFTMLNKNDFGNPDTMYFGNDNGCIVSYIPEKDYNTMAASPVCLSPEQALVYTKNKSLKDSFKIYGNEYDIVGFADDFTPRGQVSFNMDDVFFFIVAEDTYNDIYSMQSGRAKSFFYGFDADASAEESLELFEKVSNLVYSFSNNSPDGGFDMLMTESRQENAKEFYAMYGGFLFLGLFLGLVFLIAAVLIIYYKQLSEGYDDRERFEIMQKVGLSQDEIKKAIHSQILLVFFLPLAMAVLHIAFAFKMITKLLMVMGLTNLSLFALCVLGTIAVFAVIYGLVYSLTAKSYYRIVSR
ncbi:MAG: ABC transporter permease, partial [Clostridiales bacterium]|nr:ABC transporter permease [Clostridiales bacterium]